MQAPVHPQETERLEALMSKGILDTPPDIRFDRITKETIDALNVAICTVSIIDEKREWFKSCQGMCATEGPREYAFCSHALLAKVAFIVVDTWKDARFKDNPYVVGEPFIRFYAGIALRDMRSGLPLGVFCIKDIEPRKMSLDEMGIFMEKALEAEVLLNE